MEEKNDLLKYRTIVLICQELFIAKILPFPSNVIFAQMNCKTQSKNLTQSRRDARNFFISFHLWLKTGFQPVW